MTGSGQEPRDRDSEDSVDFEVRIAQSGAVFDPRDADLLRATDEHGSLNAAVDALGRSFAHAQRRVVDLEEAFGSLVERHRGGPGGGGSELTATARELLARYSRLRAEFSGVAAAPHTVLPGTVIERDGELASVTTTIGTVRSLAPPGAEEVEVSIRGDAVTLDTAVDGSDAVETSALNRFRGTVERIESGQTVATVECSVGTETRLSALVTRSSLERLGLEPGAAIVASFKATATRAVPRRPQ
ncbi:MAG: TOBE domain-containing protein [Halobacteriales archaeon]